MNRTRHRSGWRASALALIGLSAVLAVSPGCSTAVSDSTIRPMSLPEVRRLIDTDADRVLFIDARREITDNAPGIPGSLRLTPDEARLRAARGELDRYRRVVVYGENAGSLRARAMAKEIMKQGVDNVYLFAEGYEAWAGLR